MQILKTNSTILTSCNMIKMKLTLSTAVPDINATPCKRPIKAIRMTRRENGQRDCKMRKESIDTNMVKILEWITRLKYAKTGLRWADANSKMNVHLLMDTKRCIRRQQWVWIRITKAHSASSGTNGHRSSAVMETNASSFMMSVSNLVPGRKLRRHIAMERAQIVLMNPRPMLSISPYLMMSNFYTKIQTPKARPKMRTWAAQLTTKPLRITKSTPFQTQYLQLLKPSPTNLPMRKRVLHP